MKTFDAYSAYYDLLYQDKAYESEAKYVFDRLKETFGSALATVLELGCGTGNHAQLLAQRNLHVTGIDLSETMIQQAQAKALNNPNLKFLQGDVRQLKLKQQFDAVISLFHVASYQTSNNDIHSFLKTAFEHLMPGGIFLFDFWYGPAVYAQQPTVRVKRMQNDRFLVTRIAEPVHDPERCCIDVNFEVLVEEKTAGILNRIREVHPMRYFFLPELSNLLKNSGFAPESFKFEAWLTRTNPSAETWGVTAIAKKPLA
jgi:SAM-dependent methyltransferase